MYKVGIITASDSGYTGQREDISGRVIETILTDHGYGVASYQLVPDNKMILEKTMCHMADVLDVALIITTGGTGFSERDVTPEATKAVIRKRVPGIAEAIRMYSMTKTKRAMLGRGIAGIRGRTLIVNLPGSPKAVEESLTYIIDELTHGLDVLRGHSKDCARDE